MTKLIALLFIVLAFCEARPRKSFFVTDDSSNGCGYASCPSYNASAKVIFSIHSMTFFFSKLIDIYRRLKQAPLLL